MKPLSGIKNSMFCQLYNLKDEYSTGRAMILISQMLFAVGNIFISGTFYTAFLMESGIDIVQVSILSIIPNVCWLFGLFAPKVFAKIKRRRGILLFNHLFYYTCMVLLPNLIPVFVEDTGMRTVCFAVLLVVANVVNSIFASGASAWHIRFLPEVLRLLAPEGLLITDNILQEGEVLSSRFAVTRRNRTIHRRMRDYLRALMEEPALETLLLPNGDGAAVSAKK